jgi:Family of unknown function (DUF5763)
VTIKISMKKNKYFQELFILPRGYVNYYLTITTFLDIPLIMILTFAFKLRYLLLLITMVYFTFGCKNPDTYNGKYCAKVEYYNPNTGKSSEYTLTVSVENNQLIKLDFPQGYLADEDLPTASFSSNGHTSFTLDNGYKYLIDIKGPESNCFDDVPKLNQCQGVTKKGERCKKLTDNVNGLCHIHKNQ